MPPAAQFKTPAWVNRLPAAERAVALVRFRLQLAALYASQEGSLRQLSLAIERNQATLATYASRGEPIPPDTCIRIEKLLGVDLFPRDFLNPEHFTTGR